jgi:hypothetical protein
VREEELVINLENLLNQVHLSTMDDEWKCHHPTGGTFTVNSIYSFLSNSISPPPVALVVEKLLLLEYLWKSYVPYKVIVFTCQLLLGRLPTKGNLFKRRIFYETQQRDCLWCPLITESESHLFGRFSFACGLWYKIYKWIGFSSMVHPDPFVLMGMLCLAVGHGKGLVNSVPCNDVDYLEIKE